MHQMDFDGRVVISWMSISDRMDEIARQFFFICDVEKFGRFIFDRTDAT